MDVSIIIVNFNTKDITQKCIESIFQHTSDITFEIILVDNASSDGSVELFQNDNRINLVKSDANLGFGRANNLGFQYATGKYIFLLNSDTLLKNNAVKLFFDTAEKEHCKNIGCWGTMLKDKNGNIGVSYGKFPSLLHDLYIEAILLPYATIFNKSITVTSNLYNYPTKNNIVDYISGADLFIKKEIADIYGLFSPSYFLYCEETDMQKRYNKANIYSKILTEPDIIHLEGSSQQKNNYQRQLIMLQSKMTFFKRWNSKVSIYLYLLLLTPIKYLNFIVSQKDKAFRKQYIKILWE